MLHSYGQIVDLVILSISLNLCLSPSHLLSISFFLSHTLLISLVYCLFLFLSLWWCIDKWLCSSKMGFSCTNLILKRKRIHIGEIPIEIFHSYWKRPFKFLLMNISSSFFLNIHSHYYIAYLTQHTQNSFADFLISTHQQCY